MPDMPDPINQAQFAELKDLLGNEFTEMVQLYVNDSRKRLDMVQQAFSQANNQLGYEAIHSLKGASANVGASVLPELCLRLQNECRAGRIAQSDVLIHTIEEESVRLNQALLAALTR